MVRLGLMNVRSKLDLQGKKGCHFGHEILPCNFHNSFINVIRPYRQLSEISESEVACETPIYSFCHDISHTRSFFGKIKRLFFKIYRSCVIKSTKFALHTCIMKLIIT